MDSGILVGEADEVEEVMNVVVPLELLVSDGVEVEDDITVAPPDAVSKEIDVEVAAKNTSTFLICQREVRTMNLQPHPSIVL